MSYLEISALSKHFINGGNRTDVLSDINLKVEDGEFIAIVGFSGAGKSTLIAALAGLIKPDQGGIIFKGKEVTKPDPERGVVFQSYSLMPWLTVYGNVALAVDSVFKSKPRSERQAIVDKYINMVGLDHATSRKPAELSGGMCQRVAIARALAMQPEVLLLDEPLSALDALTRAKMQDEFATISQTEKKTIILITNDVDEAILLADRVIMLTPGPKATLGNVFEINLPRPRNRAAINNMADFMQLRGEITEYLMASRADSESKLEDKYSLPNIVPITQTEKLPTAYAEASQSIRQDRYVEFSQTRKIYPTSNGPLTVVDGFDLKINKGEFISLIGHSGCGKSTILSMVSGLNKISEGAIVLDGTHVTQAGPDRAVVFQKPSLLPWLTAYDNVGLGVDKVYPKASRAERREVVEYYLSRVGLQDSMYSMAAGLSNGMQQRVGIARAFALSPKLLLLDEPFGMLDSLTRWALQDVLMEVWKRTEVTTICVTHDVDEAILLADRVVMMSNGPNAKIGNIMDVNLPRPRSRKELLDHPDYYAYREELLGFLEAYEGGANPSDEKLQSIRKKRSDRIARQQAGSDDVMSRAV
jgi:nitrate/nitrite transport system ATP-binding protein